MNLLDQTNSHIFLVISNIFGTFKVGLCFLWSFVTIMNKNADCCIV